MVCSTGAPCDGASEVRAGFRTGAAPIGRGAAEPGWRIPPPRTHGLTTGDGPATSSPQAGAVLTERDRELLGHLSQGRSTAQIAAAMSVSSNTARTRIRRITAKLEVSGRPQVVGAARALGLV